MNIIEKKISVLVVLGLVAVFSFALVLTAQAGENDLTDASTTPNTFYGGRSTSYSVSFQTNEELPGEAGLRLIFPAGFNVAGASATATIVVQYTNGLPDVGTSTVSGQEITIDIASATALAASTTVHISGIPSIVNPYNGASFTLGVIVRSNALASGTVGSASSTAYTIIDAPTEVPKQTTTVTVAAPSSKITSPTSGASITAGQNYVIKGTASDVGVYDVSKVEVSLNGGSTWAQASLTKVSNSNYTWEYTWANPAAGSYTIKSRATDTAGNEESPSLGVSANVSAAAAVTPTPVSQMTASELQATITQLQQQLISLLQQLLSLLTQQLQGY